MLITRVGSAPTHLHNQNQGVDKKVEGQIYTVHVQNLEIAQVAKAILTGLSAVETVSEITLDQNKGQVRFRAADGRVGQAISAAHSHMGAGMLGNDGHILDQARARIYANWKLNN